MSQTSMILQHLEENGSITALEAGERYGCLRLAARIADLRALGYEIEREMETGVNRFEKPVRYARYRLGGN